MKVLSKFNSKEKDWVRENIWSPSLKTVFKNKRKGKLLEMLSENSETWWNSVIDRPDFELVLNGITLDPKLKLKKGKTFRRRLNALLNEDGFKNSFPYDLLNLDYYGGGRWFDPRFRSAKIKEILKIISINLKQNSEFCLIVTLETNDKIYPWHKNGEDAILSSPVRKEVEKVMEQIKDPDDWNIWLALIGNPFELLKHSLVKGYQLELLYPPCTYIGESTGHRSRMITYSFIISRNKQNSGTQLYLKLLKDISKTKFLKWNKVKEKIITKEGIRHS